VGVVVDHIGLVSDGRSGRVHGVGQRGFVVAADDQAAVDQRVVHPADPDQPRYPAKWAGNSVAVLMATYVNVIGGEGPRELGWIRASIDSVNNSAHQLISG
jgi:hypothetical protein